MQIYLALGVQVLVEIVIQVQGRAVVQMDNIAIAVAGHALAVTVADIRKHSKLLVIMEPILVVHIYANIIF